MCSMCLQELKTALGGRVKHLEAELAKSERSREELKGEKEAEVVQVSNTTLHKSPLFSCF